MFQANGDIPDARGYDPFEPVITTLYLIGAGVLRRLVTRTPSVRR